MSLNVSRTGMLFEASTLLSLGTALEMALWLSSDVLELSSDVLEIETTADVLCSGRVVRVEPKTGDGNPALAATIASHRFARS